ncbi:MAG: hypothetical protein ACI9LO_003207 [Planctomycetota bacterium]
MSADQLLAAAAVEGSVCNEAFLLVEAAGDPRHELEFAFSVKETLMLCNRQAVRVNGLAIDLFPAIDIRLAAGDGHCHVA